MGRNNAASANNYAASVNTKYEETFERLQISYRKLSFRAMVYP